MQELFSKQHSEIRYPPGNPTYPPKKIAFWVDDFPNFPFGGICIHSLEGIWNISPTSWFTEFLFFKQLVSSWVVEPTPGQAANPKKTPHFCTKKRFVHELHRSFHKRCDTKICSSNWIISMDIKIFELPPASYETGWYFSKLQTWKFPLGFFFNSSVRNWGEFSRIPELKANTAWRHGKLMGENLTKTYRDTLDTSWNILFG